MPEVIEFVGDWFAEVEGAPGRMRQVAFRKGDLLLAEIRRLAAQGGAPEAADLALADGTTARRVPLSRIAVPAQRARAA